MTEISMQLQELPAAENYQFPVIIISSKRTCFTKTVLRVLAAAAALGVVVVTGISWDKYAKLPIFTYGISAIPALVWNTAEIICLGLSRGNRGFNPSVCVALDLMIWVTFIIAIAFTIGLAQMNVYEFDNDNTDFATAERYYKATIALPPIFTAIQFVLFVISWREAAFRSHQLSQLTHARVVPDKIFYPPRERKFGIFPKIHILYGSPSAGQLAQMQGVRNRIEPGQDVASPAGQSTGTKLQEMEGKLQVSSEKEHISGHFTSATSNTGTHGAEITQKEPRSKAMTGHVLGPETAAPKTEVDKPELESPVEAKKWIPDGKNPEEAERPELESVAKVELPGRM